MRSGEILDQLGRTAGRAVAGFVAGGLAGSLLGMLRYNFEPAQIYLGDTGSMFIGLMLGGLIAGAVVVESIFSWPGVGRLLVVAVIEFPLVGPPRTVHKKLTRVNQSAPECGGNEAVAPCARRPAAATKGR